MNDKTLTAAQAGLVSCHTCDLLCHRPASGIHVRCPRCGSPMHRRKPDSLSRTWALLIASAILYIPANVLPIMTVISMGRGQPDTILSGVIHLLASGMWPLALLVFFASIVVPLLKLVVLIYLLLSVSYRSHWRPRDRTRLYRFTEWVGRWSMVDIFVITILIALVKLGELATIQANAGATAFGAVVVLTMFAAHTFDPRLIWDAMDKRDNAEVAEEKERTQRTAIE